MRPIALQTALRTGRVRRVGQTQRPSTAFQSLLGHNGGPPLDTAANWQAFCWRKASRKAGRGPGPEIAALRRRRAAGLGLDFATLAAILRDTGTTPSALAFMLGPGFVEALRPGHFITGDGGLAPGPGVADKLRALRSPALLVYGRQNDGTTEAPAELKQAVDRTAAREDWRLSGREIAPAGGATSEAADRLIRLAVSGSVRPSGLLLIGSEEEHRGLAVAARLCGLLSAERYFALPSPSAIE